MSAFVTTVWFILVDLAPWLLFGAAVAGLLHVLLPSGLIRRWLGGRGLRPVLLGSIVGVPMPLCSCAVIPTGIGLRRDGASTGASISFLISTPQTGVDSVMVTAAMLGWPFAIFKLLAAFVTGIIGGWLAGLGPEDQPSAAEQASASSRATGCCDDPTASAAPSCCGGEAAQTAASETTTGCCSSDSPAPSPASTATTCCGDTGSALETVGGPPDRSLAAAGSTSSPVVTVSGTGSDPSSCCEEDTSATPSCCGDSPSATAPVVSATAGTGADAAPSCCAAPATTASSCCSPSKAAPDHGRWRQIWDFAVDDLLRMIWRWLVIGILVSAGITLVTSQTGWSLDPSGSGVLAMFVALAISLPLYVCAVASVPIAAALVEAGLPTGAALVFLMAGPATNVATLGAIRAAFGTRTTLVYLLVIIVGSTGLGLLYDTTIGLEVGDHSSLHEHDTGGWVGTAAAVILLVLLARFAWLDLRRWLARRRATA